MGVASIPSQYLRVYAVVSDGMIDVIVKLLEMVGEALEAAWGRGVLGVRSHEKMLLGNIREE